MKKTVLIFISLIFIIFLVGCGDSQDKINIDFIIDGESHLVKIDKGALINKDIIPLSKYEVVGLYYDENMKNEYDGNILNENSKIYVKNLGKEKLYNEVCEAYLNKFIKPIRKNSTVEDVWVFEYLGTYGDSYVAVILDRKNCIFTEELHVMKIENLEFAYSNGYIINVYNNGTFLILDEAYKNNIISYDQLVQIHNKYYTNR